MQNNFNVRVYGLLINQNQQILISDEEISGHRFTKFPGGGLEYGESLIDGLKREFMEECAMEIEIVSHFYTTDFFVESIFGGGQLISIYYLVQPVNGFNVPISHISFNFISPYGDEKQAFRLLPLKDIGKDDLTFEIDKHVIELLKNTQFDVL